MFSRNAVTILLFKSRLSDVILIANSLKQNSAMSADSTLCSCRKIPVLTFGMYFFPSDDFNNFAGFIRLFDRRVAQSAVYCSVNRITIKLSSNVDENCVHFEKICCLFNAVYHSLHGPRP